MYDIRQFRAHALLSLLLLGRIDGLRASAAESPAIWVVAVRRNGLLTHGLLKTGRFVPMSRILANFVTLIALVLVTLEVRAGDTTPILTVDKISIVLLHLVKLFEHSANPATTASFWCSACC